MAAKRWLGRNGGLVIIVIAVVGTVFGTRQFELAIGDHHERLMSAQVVVAQLQSSTLAVFQQAQDALRTPDSPVGYERSKTLRSAYLGDAARMLRIWPGATSRQIAAQAATLSAEVEQMLALAQAGEVQPAQQSDRTVVASTYRRARRRGRPRAAAARAPDG